MRFPVVLLAAALAPADAQTISDALDAPGLTWNNPAGTLVQNDVTHDGVDAVRLARTGTTALSAELTGPARVTLLVRTSTEANADYFEASVSGFTVARISGEQPWQTVTLEVPAGAQRVDLLYRRDAMTAHGADSVWVDEVNVTPVEPLSVAEAVDANLPGAITVTTAAAEWFTLRTADLSAEGGDVLVLRPSPATATTGAVRLRLPFIGRGRLSFALRYEGTGTPGYVTPDWPLRSALYSQPSPAAGSYVTLEYVQPLDAPVPAAAVVIPVPQNLTALVDRVRGTPFAAVSVSEALDTTPLPWQSLGGVLAVLTPEAQDGADAVLFHDAGAAVALPLTGPAHVTWLARNSQTFSVDSSTRTGTQVAALPDGWSRHEYLVPPGARTLRWQTSGTGFTSFDQHGRLDQVTVTPLTTVSIPEALDAPGLTWTTPADTAWAGTRGDPAAVEGDDVVRMSAGTSPSGDWLETTGTGAGRLHFAWGGVMTCTVNGTAILTSPGTNPLTRGVVEVPAGAWTVRWTTGSSSTTIPGLDAVSFSPGENESLGSIADASGGVSVVAARAREFAGPVHNHDGAPGRQLLLEGNPVLTFETTGAGVLRARVWAVPGATFSWNTAGQSGSSQQAGTGGWLDLDITLSSATPARTTLSIFSADAFAVDSLAWITGSMFTAEEALETTGVTWTESHTGGTGGWVGRPVAAAANAGDTDAMMVPAMTGPAEATLSATLTGSGWLTFTRLTPSGVTFTVRANGVELFSGSQTSGNWQREYVELPGAGPHAVVFTATRTSATTSSVTGLSGISILPWQVVTDGAAADMPDTMPLRTTPQRPFRGTTGSNPARAQYLSAVVVIAAATVLEATVDGPGWLSCDAKGTRLLLDGANAATQMFDWTSVMFPLPPGNHTLRLEASATRAAELDSFRFQPAAAVTHGEALDQPGWTWTVLGPWSATVPPAVTHDGADALVFTGIGDIHGSVSTVSPGAGLLSFWWWRSSSAPLLMFSAGGPVQNQRYTERWERVFVEVPAAGTVLTWSTINGSPFGPGRYSLVDDVRFIAYSDLSLADALDTPGRIWTTGSPPWRTLDDGPAGGDATDYAIAPRGANVRWLETAVTHPVWVEYDTEEAGTAETKLEADGNTYNHWLPALAGSAPGLVRRRQITIGTGPGTMRFYAGNDNSDEQRPHRLDRVFIGASVSLAEALDSPASAWTNEAGNAVRGFQMSDAVEAGDAVAMLMNATTDGIVTSVTGPGELALRCHAELPAGNTAPRILANLKLDGVTVFSAVAGTGWQEVRHRVPPGAHMLRLESAPLPSGLVLADHFRFTPGGADIAALAMDFPGATSGGGDAGWSEETVGNAVAGTALHTPDSVAEPDAVRSLTLAFGGAGSLAFNYQLQAAAPQQASLTLLLDGSLLWTAPPSTEWTTVNLPVIADGSHLLTWQWKQSAPGARALLDAMTLTPFTSVSVGQALDTTGRTWTAENCTGIAGSGVSQVNDDAVRMVVEGGVSSTARVTTNVTGPVRVSFRWRVDSVETGTGLSFLAGPNGYQIAARKVNEWEQVDVDVPSGSFSLEWGAFSAAGPLRALLDDVRITPVTPPSSYAAALDLPAGVTVTASASAWRLVTAPSVEGNDAVIGTNALSGINISVPGPGVLELTCSLPGGILTPSFSDAVTPPYGELWRQRNALYGQDLVRYRFMFTGSGSHRITIAGGGGALLMLDAGLWSPAGTVTLAEALDTPGLTWLDTGLPRWQGFTSHPARPDDPVNDVALLSAGASSSALQTTVTGPFALNLRGLEGGELGVWVDDIYAGNDLATETVYLTSPGPHNLKLAPRDTVTSPGLSLDSVVLTPNPSPPDWLAGPGVNLTIGPGRWRSQAAGNGVPAAALRSLAESNITQAITATLNGAGALEFYVTGAGGDGGRVTADGVLTASLPVAAVWQRYRLELPAALPHTVVFYMTHGSIADLRWTPGPPALTTASGISGSAFFVPADAFSVLPGGGLCADAAPGDTGLIIAETGSPATFTWWQQSLWPDEVSSPGNSNLFSMTTASEADPAPVSVSGLPWKPWRMALPPFSAAMTWVLSGRVCLGNVRSTVQSVPLAEALDLPPGVATTEVTPGSAAGYALASASGGDVVGLRAGEERALRFTMEGPAILSFTTSRGIRVLAGALPPVDVLNGRCHVLLEQGSNTVILGTAPGSTVGAQIDNVALLPLTFDPVAVLGGGTPLVVLGPNEPATWPFVITSGASGMALSSQEQLYVACGGPARLVVRSSAGFSAAFSIGTTQNSGMWPAGSGTLWFDRAATTSLTKIFNVPGTFVREIRLDPAPAVAFPQALDGNGLNYGVTGGVFAHSLPQGAVDGSDAVAFPLGGGTRALSSQVIGPGRVRFWWRAHTLQAGTVSCRVGADPAISNTSPEWKQADLAVPAGMQSVLWLASVPEASAELDRVEFFPQWSFSTWAAQNALAALPAASRALADTDGDGAAGLLEFAFGLDPGVADAALFAGSLATGPDDARGLPVLRVARALDGLDYLELHFPRRLNSGLTYQMQATADPSAWSDTGTLEVLRPLGADWELCRTRDSLPLDSARPRRLVRLRVTQP